MLISHVKAGGTYRYHWSLKGQHKCGERSEMSGTQAIFAGVFLGFLTGNYTIVLNQVMTSSFEILSNTLFILQFYPVRCWLLTS
jgi:hypothetical protein